MYVNTHYLEITLSLSPSLSLSLTVVFARIVDDHVVGHVAGAEVQVLVGGDQVARVQVGQPEVVDSP